MHIRLSICAYTHNLYRNKASNLLPHQKYRLFLFLEGMITICGRKRSLQRCLAWRVSMPRQSLLSTGVYMSRAPCDSIATGFAA